MLRFVHISDTHIGEDSTFMLYQKNTYAGLKALVRTINALPFTPDFVLHTGDVTNTYDDRCMQLAAAGLAELNYPLYYAVGNHDGRGAMREHLLKVPRNDDRYFYDFIQRDVHFLVLDTVGSPDPQGYISEEQLDWLRDKCATSLAQSICLVVHHIPVSTDVPWLNENMQIMNNNALFNILVPHRERLRGVFFGHIHRAFTAFREGIVCSAAPSAFAQFHLYPGEERPAFDFDAPGGFSVVTIRDQETIITHHTIPQHLYEQALSEL